MGKFKRPEKRISELAAAKIEAAVSQAALCQSQINQAVAGLQAARAKVKAVCDANGVNYKKIESGELFIATDGRVVTRKEVEAMQKANGKTKEDSP